MSLLKKIIKTLFLFAAILFFCIAAVYLALPFIAQKLLTAAISETLHGKDVSADVRTLTFSRLDVSDVRIGDRDNPLLFIDTIRCDYTPKGLLGREIEKVTISGLTLSVVFSDKGLEIPFIDIDMDMGTEADAAPPAPLPGVIRRLEILNSRLTLVLPETRMDIPFTIKAAPVPHETEDICSRYQALLTLSPLNQKIEIAAAYDLLEGDGHVAVTAEKLDLGVLSNALAPFTGQVATGELGFNLAADISGDTIALSSLEIPALSLRQNGLEIGLDTEGSRLSVHPEAGGYRVLIRGLSVKQPIPVRVQTDLNGLALETDGTGVRVTGNLRYRVDTEALDLPVEVVRFPEGVLKLNASVQNDLTWRVTATTPRPVGSHAAVLDDMNMVFSLDRLALQAQGDDSRMSAGFEIALSALTCQSKEMHLAIPSLNYSGTLAAGDEPPFTLASKLTINGGALRVDDLLIRDVRARVPIQHPVTETTQTPNGWISIGNTNYADYNLGSVAAEISVKPLGILMNGAAKLFPGTALDLSGDLSLNMDDGFAFSAAIKVSDIEKHIQADIETISPDFSGISLNGKIQAEANLRFENSVLEGMMSAWAAALDVVLADEDMEITGIEAVLEIEDLFTLRSRPAQRVAFDGLRIGEIKTAGGEARFALESAESILIEKARLGWAGGNVYTYAVRMVPGLWDIDLILFCDRLKLKDILNELGIAEADGEGTVSGRIPLSIRAGDIDIQDGFLYSEPGQGGSLKIKNTETFDALDHSLQMSIAKDALRDFYYDWAKLTLNTHNDTLLIPFQLYGRPVAPMRYAYDKKQGLKKTEDSRFEAKFEGIQFDINFSLPLNRLLGYKKGVDHLMKIK